MMKVRITALLSVSMALGVHAHAGAQFLGTADSFAVLAGSTVTNTGPTILSGNLGISPGTAITGFPPGSVTNGTTHVNDAVALQAQSDVTTAYNVLATEAYTQDLSGQNLGGLTLLPGVYHFSSSAFLTGVLTLNTSGNPNSRFDFQIGSTLVTSSNSSVRLLNSSDDCNVFWQVGSSATIGTGTTFTGHILALTSITLNTGSQILGGSALARNGAITLDSNSITTCISPTNSVPEPASFVFYSVAGLFTFAFSSRRRNRKSVG